MPACKLIAVCAAVLSNFYSDYSRDKPIIGEGIELLIKKSSSIKINWQFGQPIVSSSVFVFEFPFKLQKFTKRGIT